MNNEEHDPNDDSKLKRAALRTLEVVVWVPIVSVLWVWSKLGAKTKWNG